MASNDDSKINTMNVGVCGDLFLDIQANGLNKLPKYNEDNLVDSISFIPGGSAANTARQLSIFPNINCSLLSTAGNDTLYETILNYVKNEPCNFQYVKQIDNTPTASCIVLCSGVTGDRGYVTCNGSLNKLNHKILVENENTLINKLNHLHIGGFFNTLYLHNDEFINTLVEFKNKYKSLTYSLDSNSISTDTNPIPYFMKLLPILDILFLNKSELIEILNIYNKYCDIKIIYNNDSDINDIMNDLINIGKANNLVIVLKMGANGSLVRLTNGKLIRCEYNENIKLKNVINDDEIKQDNFDEFKVIDTTGAGDCFNAGFLGEWLMNNKSNDENKYFECLLCGNCCGSIRCTMIGGCSKPIDYKKIIQFKRYLKDQYALMQSK